MKLTTPQRTLLLVGMVFAIALLPLIGSLHHHEHHDDALGGCWFCTTASTATLPLFAICVALALVAFAFCCDSPAAPSWSLWLVPFRRGPPSRSLAQSH
jgi:hypothetical protein